MTSEIGGLIDFPQISETCHKVNKKKQLNEEKCEKEFLLLIIICSKWLSINI